MSQLQQLTTRDIWCPDEGSAEPGKFVKHIADDKSYGMIVARVDDQVSVLWSKQPNLIPHVDIKVQTVDIKATSRKLKATWSVEHEEDTRFLASQFAPGELEEIARQPGAHITYHQPGADGDMHVEVMTEKLVETPFWKRMYAGDR